MSTVSEVQSEPYKKVSVTNSDLQVWIDRLNTL